VVIASRHPRVLGTYFRGTPHEATDAAAIAVPTFDEVFDWVYTPTGGAVSGDRVILHPTLLDDIGTYDLRLLLVHEITHVALRPRGGPGVPRWLVEGVATWMEDRTVGVDDDRLTGELAEQLDTGFTQFPSSVTFYSDDPDSNYQLSRQLVAHIADRYGVARLTRLYERFGRFDARSAHSTGSRRPSGRPSARRRRPCWPGSPPSCALSGEPADGQPRATLATPGGRKRRPVTRSAIPERSR
jgi:hypothetical protein